MNKLTLETRHKFVRVTAPRSFAAAMHSHALDPIKGSGRAAACRKILSPVLVCLLFALLALGGRSQSFAAEQASRAFHLPSLYHVGFWVHDIAKAREFYHDFLGFDEPYELRRPNGDLQMVVMKVNERQVILLFTDAAKILPNGDNLDHLGLETDNIESVRTCLLAHGVKVGTVNRGRIGDFLLGMNDPDGHHYEVTQFAPEGQLLKNQGKGLATGRVSARLRSATLATADLVASRRFYVEILGFKEITGADHVNAVRMQVPDGTDFLEFVPYERSPGAEAARAVPEYCLEVADAAKTAELLSARARALGIGPPATVTVAADGRRQTSVVDPDGTRVVLREVAPKP